MWDIESIIQQHNQYALAEMMSTLRIEVAQTPQPDNWALSVLVSKLRSGPPVLSELLAQFTSVDVMAGFLELIMRYLPGHEAEILAERGEARVYRFCQLWGRTYFPLPEMSWDQSLKSFVRAMPVRLLGMSYTAYHELDMRPGYIMLLSLLRYPYEGDERDNEDDRVPFDPLDPMKNLDLRDGTYTPAASDIAWLKDLVEGLAVGGTWVAPIGFSVVKKSENTIELIEAKNIPEVRELVIRTVIVAEKAGIKAEFNRTGRTAEDKLYGARVALLDRARQIAGDDAAKLILPAGWGVAHVHRLTDGTLYDGAGAFADWAFGVTGCEVLDHNYEDCSYNPNMGTTEPYFKWSERNIKFLTEDAPKVRQIREKIDNIVEFLEGDPPARFSELLGLLRSQAPDEHAEGIGYDPTEHCINLDEVDFEEEEDEDE